MVDIEEGEELGKKFREAIMEDQINNCEKLIEEILLELLDLEENKKVYEKADINFDTLKKTTIDIFRYSKQIEAFFGSYKELLTAIADDRGYLNKMKRFDNGVKCEFEKSLYWFKMYSEIIIKNPRNIRYEYAYRNLKNFRNADYHQYLSREAQFHPVIVSLIIMLWYTLEDILERWKKIIEMDNEVVKERRKILNSESEEDKKYGFIDYVCYRIDKPSYGFITSYIEGEGGDSTYFDMNKLILESKERLLPSNMKLNRNGFVREIKDDGIIGKVVKFKDEPSEKEEDKRKAVGKIMVVE